MKTKINKYNQQAFKLIGLLIVLFSFINVSYGQLNLISTSPVAATNNVAVNANIVLNFDAAINAVTVNSDNIRVNGELTGLITGVLSGGGTSTITFDPANDLLPGEVIHVTLTTGLQNTSSQSLVASYTFTFRTPPTNTFPIVGINERLVSSTAFGASSVDAADIDKDGDMDVLSSTYDGDEIAWYENDGSQNWTKHIISATADGAKKVQAVDIDGDGDLDIVSGSSYNSYISWYENDGSQNFTQHTVGSFSSPLNVYAIDMDGDADMDIIAIANTGSTDPVIYVNDGNQNFTADTIGAISASAAHPIDMDHDGDMDLVYASSGNSKIGWYENDGAFNFTEHTISNTTGNGWEAYPVDLDDDGDIDLVFASEANGTIEWYENDGSQNFTNHVVLSGLFYPTRVYVADMNGDNNMDILATNRLADQALWLENNGSEVFTSHLLDSSIDNPTDIYSADIDGDGDLDALASTSNEDKIIWYEFACSTNESVNANVCIGGSYTFPDNTVQHNITSQVVQTSVLVGVNVHGCDSIIETTVNVLPTYLNALPDVSICPGDSALIFGNYQTVAGIYYDSLTTINGCDSVFSRTLIINPTYNFNETVAVHSGDTVTFPDNITQQILTDSVTHVSSLVTVNGCDSIIHTTVLLTPDSPPNTTCDGVLDFDGVDDYVDHGNFYHPNNRFTVEFWANIPSTLVPWDHLVENGGVQYGFDEAYRMEVGNEGEIYCALGNGSAFHSTGTLNVGWEYGEWNHHAFTYDGDTARFFLNGVERHKYYASGLNITGGDGTLFFGRYGPGGRYYDGMLDEVRIWDEARTSQQLVANMDVQLTGSETNLLGYWNFNEGVGSTLYDQTSGGTNGTLSNMDTIMDWVSVNANPFNTVQSPAICSNDSVVVGTSVYNTAGNYTDVLTSGAGCDSVVVTNLTINPSYSDTINTINICSGDSALIFGNYENVAGVYTNTLSTVNACDSIETILLNVTTVDTAVNVSGFTLTANASGASYQWLDCDNNYVIIGGATNQAYTPSVNGNYALSVTQNGCTDTSACYNIVITGINDVSSFNQVVVYPNPVNNFVTINFAGLKVVDQVMVSDLRGRIIYQSWNVSTNKLQIDLSEVTKGVYLLRIDSESRSKVYKVIKN